MTRTRVRWPVVILLSLALSIGFLVGRASGGSAASSGPAASYVVRRGDTLWGIARDQLGPAADPRPLVARIAALNGLRGSAVEPGEDLLLPPVP